MNKKTYHQIEELLKEKAWCESKSFKPSTIESYGFRWPEELEKFATTYMNLLDKWKQKAKEQEVSTFEDFKVKFYTEWWLSKLYHWRPLTTERVELEFWFPTFRTPASSDDEFTRYVPKVDIKDLKVCKWNENDEPEYIDNSFSEMERILRDAYDEIYSHVDSFRKKVKELQKNHLPQVLQKLEELGYK